MEGGQCPLAFVALVQWHLRDLLCFQKLIK